MSSTWLRITDQFFRQLGMVVLIFALPISPITLMIDLLLAVRRRRAVSGDAGMCHRPLSVRVGLGTVCAAGTTGASSATSVALRAWL
ncbi:hypothetical protein ACIPK7_27590 [Pseudomonas sp. NPDC086581]|uniref:hypothetical protein n=1 Tax=Pseudomonas sp. NPDC086581 TaxID=3364432 RepID=UPI0038184EF6